MGLRIWLYTTILVNILSHISCSEDRPLDAILEEKRSIEALLAHLKDVVDRSVVTVRNVIVTIDSNIHGIALDVISAANEQIYDDIDHVREQLIELRMQAMLLDATYCFSYKEKQLDFISTDVQREIKTCVDNIILETEFTIGHTLHYITFAQERINELESDWVKCDHSNDLSCMVKFRGEVQLALSGLSTQVVDQAVLILLYSKDWEEGLHACSRNKVGLVVVEGDKVVAEVEECLAEARNNQRMLEKN